MKSLHLLRHAKSSWKDPSLNDHDRPLSKRGRETAKTMATYLRRAKIVPDLVICSTAMRARQMLNPIAKAKKPPKVVLEREIYGGTQQALWEQLWNLPESAKSVLLIGHNPALHDLALELAQANLNKLLPSAGGKLPPGAMASFRFDGAWKALEPHGAELASYIYNTKGNCGIIPRSQGARPAEMSVKSANRRIPAHLATPRYLFA